MATLDQYIANAGPLNFSMYQHNTGPVYTPVMRFPEINSDSDLRSVSFFLILQQCKYICKVPQMWEINQAEIVYASLLILVNFCPDFKSQIKNE